MSRIDTLWITGLPSSGKSTFARRVADALRAEGIHPVVLDGDEVRDAYAPGWGYDEAGRNDFYKTLADLAGTLSRQGHLVIVAATSNKHAYRDYAKRVCSGLFLVHMQTDLETCRQRDAKGLYAAADARGGTLPGMGADFEAPSDPDLTTLGRDEDVARVCRQVIRGADASAEDGADQVVPHAVQRLLTELEGEDVELDQMAPIAADRAEGELKQAGYGEPLFLAYTTRSGRKERRVLRTMGANWFGHDRRSDRAAMALLSYDTFPCMPKQVPRTDVGGITASGRFASMRHVGELYLLTEFADGELYAKDLRRFEKEGACTPLDIERAEALADYLAEVHARLDDGAPQMYEREIRDLIGSGEGIFGIADSYPLHGPVAPERIAELELEVVRWRQRLKLRSDRLRRTHGDFHPYNILFREGVDFSVLDASRGCVGEPADDLAALTINYVFCALRSPSPRGASDVWEAFWRRYLRASGDDDVTTAIAPFFAWRAMVLASPIWYPDLELRIRDALLGFAERALAADRFEPAGALTTLTG